MRAGGRHGADDRLGEGARLARGADERAGTEPPDDLLELDPTAHGAPAGRDGGIGGDLALLSLETGPVGEDEPARIEAEHAARQLGGRHPVGRHGRADRERASRARGAGAVEDHPLVVETPPARRSPARMPATMTAPVPWTSSSNEGITFR